MSDCIKTGVGNMASKFSQFLHGLLQLSAISYQLSAYGGKHDI
ncbi:hypothetical protein [Moorena sp. SIO3E8]|nr:hypothetical protein [Moorena sp. SIO3E8]